MSLKKILSILGFSSLFNLYDFLKERIIQLRCAHIYTYWDTIFKEVDSDGNLKDYKKFSTIENTHRLCKLCGKRERLNMTVGKWNWERVYYDFPDGEPFTAIHNPRGIKTVKERRDELLNELLNKIVK